MADTSCRNAITSLEPQGDPRAPAYRVELSVTSDLGTVVKAREIATANINGLNWQVVFVASDFWNQATQWPRLNGGNPTWKLTGYALPDGLGGTLGTSSVLTGQISLVGCGG